MLRFRDDQLPAHVGRDGFRCATLRVGGRLAGFAYGYTGARGQWWSDQLAERAPQPIVDAWLGGHFDFVALAVDPACARPRLRDSAARCAVARPAAFAGAADDLPATTGRRHGSTAGWAGPCCTRASSPTATSGASSCPNRRLTPASSPPPSRPIRTLADRRWSDWRLEKGFNPASGRHFRKLGELTRWRAENGSREYHRVDRSSCARIASSTTGG